MDVTPAVIEEAKKSVVIVGKASGVVVAPQRVVTCSHVTERLDEGDTITIRYEGTDYPARIVRDDKSRDLCLLEVPELQAPVAPLAQADNATPGAEVAAIGMPGGECEVNQGKVEYINGGGAPVIFSSAPISVGHSGGGLFDKTGHLTGISAYRGNGSIPVEWLAHLLSGDWSPTPIHTAPQTEMDFFLEMERHWQNSQRSYEVAHQWNARYPGSYWASLELGHCLASERIAETLGTKAAECCYQASQKAHHMHPCPASLWVYAQAAAHAGHTKEAIDLLWQFAKENPERQQDILRDICYLAKNLPPRERFKPLKDALTVMTDEHKGTAYLTMSFTHLDLKQLPQAVKNLLEAARYEKTIMQKFCLVSGYLKILAIYPDKASRSYRPAVEACLKEAIRLIYETPELQRERLRHTASLAAPLEACLGEKTADDMSARVLREAETKRAR